MIPLINLLIKYHLCFQSKKVRGTFYNTSQEAPKETTQNLSVTPLRHIQQQLLFWWLCNTGFLLKPTKRRKEKPPVCSGLDLSMKLDWKLMASTCYQNSLGFKDDTTFKYHFNMPNLLSVFGKLLGSPRRHLGALNMQDFPLKLYHQSRLSEPFQLLRVKFGCQKKVALLCLFFNLT